jgi:PAS domain S-box-containing protein
MEDKKASNIKNVNCWKVFQCKEKDCPAYKSEDLRCWLFSGTHCREKIQGKFFEKMEICINCEVFKKNLDVQRAQETFNLVNKQLKEFRQIVNDRDASLQNYLLNSQKRQDEITALLEASRAVHEYHDFKSSAKVIFDICKNLIGATSGYIALLSKDGAENEVLFLESGGLSCAVDPKLPMPIRGLRAEAYHKAKAIYHNDFSNSDFLKFMPKGHVRLRNVLFAPMIIQEKTIGLFGLANKPEGFTDNDAKMATAFGELAGIALINKRTEEALREERDKVKNYLDIAGVIIVIIDSDQKVSLINKKGCEILGYAEKDIIGKKWFNNFIPKRIRDEVKATFNKLMTGEIKPVEYFENPILTKDNEERIIAWHNTFLRNEDSKIVATLSSGEDITDRKKAEDERRWLTSELKRSNADLQQFAYAAAHDLQEPLIGIAGFGKLLSKQYKGKYDAKADELIAFINDGVKRMQHLIKDLLEYSRIGTERTKFKLIDSSMPLALALANLQRSIEENGVVITYDTLPEVFAVSSQLSMLFQNLIGNAIKFRTKAPPNVHISVERNEDEWVFSISDNGLGIDPSKTESIFVVFNRLHSKEEYPGTGIGLAICKKIVERHSGRIWVESKPGKGSTFFFTLPERQTKT